MMIYLVIAMLLLVALACMLVYALVRKADAERRLTEAYKQFAEEKTQMHDSYQREKQQLRADHELDLQRQKVQMDEQMQLFQDRLQLQTQAMLRQRQEELQHRNDEQMEALMRPLREQITSLREQLSRNREDRAARDAQLREMLNGFVRQAAEMGAATDKLANAMMSNGKVHGDWGEQVLERILEACGMQRGIHYEVQASQKDGDGRDLRPDVYIFCPRNRRIVIDSKVSLTAYSNYLSAHDHDEAKHYDEENYRSVKMQVDRLAGKGYNTLHKDNFHTVLMFIPNEGAYILAMRHNPELGQYAYRKGVVILTPTNLMLTLQLIEGLWQKENEQQNIQHILQTAGSLYEKFAAFSERMAQLKRSLDAAENAFAEASSYLTDGRGNVVRQLERLSGYGAIYNKSKKVNAILAPDDDE